MRRWPLATGGLEFLQKGVRFFRTEMPVTFANLHLNRLGPPDPPKIEFVEPPFLKGHSCPRECSPNAGAPTRGGGASGAAVVGSWSRAELGGPARGGAERPGSGVGPRCLAGSAPRGQAGPTCAVAAGRTADRMGAQGRGRPSVEVAGGEQSRAVGPEPRPPSWWFGSRAGLGGGRLRGKASREMGHRMLSRALCPRNVRCGLKKEGLTSRCKSPLL